MCTNRALVDSLECYMDELVDCFEDFIRKSIVVISLAVGILVGLIAYTLKTITERTAPTAISIGDAAPAGSIQMTQKERIHTSSGTCVKCKHKKAQNRTAAAKKGQDSKGTNSISSKSSCLPCADEKVLNTFGFPECSNTDCSRKNRKTEKKSSNTRFSIPSLPTSNYEICTEPRLETAKDGQQTDTDSCCSLCCNDNCEE